jgi:hypothetical protein
MRRLVPVLLVLAAVPAAAQVGTWGTPVNVPGINTTVSDYYPNQSGDGLTLRWSSSRTDIPGGVGGWDVFQAVRPDRHSPFGPVTREPGGINSTTNDLSVQVMPDELTAYVVQQPLSNADIYVCTRSGPAAPWGPSAIIAPLVSTSVEYGNTVTADGTYMLFSSGRAGGVGGQDIYESYFVAGAWTPPVLVAPLSTTLSEYGPCMSPDGLAVFLSTNSGNQISMSTRKLRTDPWGAPVVVLER